MTMTAGNMPGNSSSLQTISTALPASGLVWRVCGVPLEVDQAGLAEMLKLQADLGGTHNDVEILTLTPNEKPDFQTATILFCVVPQSLVGGHLLQEPIEVCLSSENSLEPIRLTLDTRFDGLTVLFSPPPQQYRIDILAVCGLGGHPIGSFSHKSREGERRHNWLRDSLPGDLSAWGARVATYGYESGLQNSTSLATLQSMADPLRDAIISLTSHGRGVPLVLIGHSMGGLLIKEALVALAKRSPEVADAIAGCLFFGVPNDGIDIESLVPLVNNQPNRALLESLATTTPQTLWVQNSEFSAVLSERDIEVFCFYETKLSRTAARDPRTGTHKMIGEERCLVTPASATSFLPQDVRVHRSKAMNRTHSDLVKFAKGDKDYIRVLAILDQICKKVVDSTGLTSANQQGGVGRESGLQIRYSNWRGIRPGNSQHQGLGRNPDFIDRPDIFAKIETTLASHSRVALVGFGGVGKSQIANEYLYRLCSHSRDMLLWVQGSTQEVFEQSYRHIAVQIGLPGRDDPRVDTVALVSRWLRDKEGWIMALDSVDDTKNAKNFLRFLPPNGRFLITSRRADVAERFTECNTHISVGPMTVGMASALLNKRLQDDVSDEEANGLVKVLDCIPLAIIQAAAFINSTRGSNTVGQYTAEILSDNAGKVPKPIISTWWKSFTHIRHEAPPAAHLLSLLSFFDREEIPLSLINGFSSNQGLSILSGSEVSNAIDLLHNFSFLRRSKANVYSMHRMVQRTMLEWLEDNGQHEIRRTEALKGILGIFPPADKQDWGTCRTLMAHAESILKFSVCDQDQPAWVALYNTVTFYSGGWRDATVRKTMAETAVKKTEKLLVSSTPSNAQVLVCAHRIVPVLLAEGQYKKAQSYAEKSFDGRRQILGKDHDDTLASALSLAMVLDCLGNYEESERYCRLAVEGRKRALEETHADKLHTMLCHSIVLQHQGHYKEAENLGNAVVAIRRKTLGPEHLDTLLSEVSRATTHRTQGRWSEAEETEVRVKEAMILTLGADHFQTLTVMGNLALTYRYQGRWREADELNELVLKKRESVLGERHPDTISSMTKLALTHRDQGKFNEACTLAEKAVELQEEVLGNDHPDTLAARNNLALVYSDQGRWDDAKRLNEQVVQDRTRIIGAEHPDTLMTKANLALSYADEANWEAAEELNQSVIDSRERVLGADHPATLVAQANLATIYTATGRFDRAEKLEREVMEKRRTNLGPEHPDTLTIQSNLATTCANQKKWEEAVLLGTQVVEARKRVLTEKHPDTLMSMANLAVLYSDQKKWGQAEELERKVLNDRTGVLGSGHPDALTSMSNLAFTLKAQRKREEAIRYLKMCLEGVEALGTETSWAEDIRTTLRKWRRARR